MTWVCGVFRVLYLRMAGEILPRLNRILKIRSKKRERTRGDATKYDGERVRVEAGYSGRLGYAAGSSTALLHERAETQTQWVSAQLGGRTTSTRKPVSKAYRAHRMKVKLADGLLARKLRGLALRRKAGKGGKVGNTNSVKGTKPTKRSK